MKRTILGLFTFVLASTLASLATARSTDPLPSWNDGKTKQSIIDFVERVTEHGSSDYVPPEARIATFDQDGTLWCEQPVVQMEFVIHQIKKMAPQHPEWKDQQPYKAVLEGDRSYLVNDIMNNHGAGLMELFAATSSGMPLDQFIREVQEFFSASRHPKFNQGYTETIYQPMLEVLEYLRAWPIPHYSP